MAQQGQRSLKRMDDTRNSTGAETFSKPPDKSYMEAPPAQKEEWPGHEAELKPKADHGEDS